MTASGTSTPSEDKPAAAPARKRMSEKRRKILTRLGIVFLILAVLYFFYWLIWSRFEIYTDDAYVSGNLVQLMPQVRGTVVSINTDDTNLVQEGQLLVKLDPADTTVALEKASANLAQTVRQVRQYYEVVKQNRASVALRKADLEKATLDVKRRMGLVGERVISAEESLHYQTAADTAKAQYNAALAQLASATALVEKSHLYQHPLVDAAKANFKVAYLNWIRTSIYAPAKGYVAKRNAQVGQQVTMGSALMAVIPLSQIWVDANYKESQLNGIRIGQDVILKADAYGSYQYHGKVVGLSSGTGSAFSLLPPQNATGNWIKIVQRLPVRISLDPNEIEKRPLRIGLSMRVTVDISKNKGDVLTKVADQKPLYVTTIYNNQLAHAEQLINHIVSANSSDIYFQDPTVKAEKNNA